MSEKIRFKIEKNGIQNEKKTEFKMKKKLSKAANAVENRLRVTVTRVIGSSASDRLVKHFCRHFFGHR